MANSNNGLSKEQRAALSRSDAGAKGRPEKKDTVTKLNDVLVSKPKRRIVTEPEKQENRLSFTEHKATPRQSRTESGRRNTARAVSGNDVNYTRYDDQENVREYGGKEYTAKPVKTTHRPISKSEKSAGLDAPAMVSTGFKYRGRFDISLFIIVMVLAVFGITMMTSASYAYSLYKEDSSFAYMFQQLQGFAIGFVFLLIMARLDYRVLATPIKHFFQKGKATAKNPFNPPNNNGINICHLFFAFAMALMVLTFFFGEEVAGARRWLSIAGLRFQPSEIMKVAMVMLIAVMMHRLYPLRDKIKYGFLPYILVIGVCAGFCALQRHYSAFFIVCVIGVALMIGHGSNKYAMIIICAIGVAAVAFVIITKPSYLGDRITGWFDPFFDVENTTYQTSQSLVTIGSGGWFGRGLGNSIQKYYYLPEAQNDFVFSVICEELGFIGGLTVILLFVLFEVRGFLIAARAKDRFGSMLALGITVQIGLQAMFNIGVACNAFPNTGISLPFFSFGRTALIIQLIEAGILLSISRDSDT